MAIIPCQFQTIVSQFFRDHSRLVAKWPLPFLVFPLLITTILGGAFFTNKGALNAKQNEEDRLNLFLPDDVESIEHLKRLAEIFPPTDAIRENYDMFGTSYAYVIIEDASEQRNVLRNSQLLIAADINNRVHHLEVKMGPYRAGYRNLCYSEPQTDSCLQHPIIVLLNNSDPISGIRYFLHYPTQKLGNLTVDNTMILGSVTLIGDKAQKRILRAEAIRLPFLLRQGYSEEERAIAVEWQKEFVSLMTDVQYPGVNIYYSAAVSWSMEIERNGQLIVPFMPLLFVVLILFSVCSCFTSDCVQSKPWLGICGIINAFCAVIATVGLLVYVGYPFLEMVSIMPFLILSISVDNMFLMLNSWRATHPFKSVEDRMAKAIGDTAVSIMITALTDGLSFSVGSISKFPAVRIFCTYCAMAILFVFLFQMTFFTACMALTGRRESANRHCFACIKATPKAEAETRSILFRLFCTGGYDSKKGPRVIPNKIQTQVTTEFLSTTFADFLQVWAAKAFIVLCYIIYIGGAIFGCLQLPLGLDLKMLVPRDSYISKELKATTRHFTSYGGHAFVMIDGELDYHATDTRMQLLELYDSLTTTPYTAEGEFWLTDFNGYTNGRQYTTERQFLVDLSIFLRQRPYAKYRNDIRQSAEQENYGQIEACKFLVRMRNVGVENHTAIARTLRAIFESSEMPGFIYESSFLLVDQQDCTVRNVIQNVVIAVGVMILIAIVFMPNLTTALWIGVSILSINLGVVGGLALWSVRLDIVSMITIIMSIGFSVDFAAHITYHYVISGRSKSRLHRALRYVGTPILQSAASTVLGVLSLAPVDSYMVRTFVKTVVLVVGLGVLHGLIFLPVFLSLLLPTDPYLESLNAYGKKISHYLATNVPKYLQPIRNKRMHCYFAEDQNREAQESGSDSIHRSRVGGLHARKRPPSPPPHRTERANSLDLYDFLKYKASQQRQQELSGSETIYSELGARRVLRPTLAHVSSKKPSPTPTVDMLSESSAATEEGSRQSTEPSERSSELPLLSSLNMRRANGSQRRQNYSDNWICAPDRNTSIRREFPPAPKDARPRRAELPISETVRIVLGEQRGSRRSVALDNLPAPRTNQNSSDSDEQIDDGVEIKQTAPPTLSTFKRESGKAEFEQSALMY